VGHGKKLRGVCLALGLTVAASALWGDAMDKFYIDYYTQEFELEFNSPQAGAP